MDSRSVHAGFGSPMPPLPVLTPADELALERRLRELRGESQGELPGSGQSGQESGTKSQTKDEGMGSAEAVQSANNIQPRTSVSAQGMAIQFDPMMRNGNRNRRMPPGCIGGYGMSDYDLFAPPRICTFIPSRSRLS